MNEQTLGYVIIVVLSVVVGVLGTKVFDYRKSASELRNDNSGSESENRRAREEYKDAQRIIKEIREEQQIKE